LFAFSYVEYHVVGSRPLKHRTQRRVVNAARGDRFDQGKIVGILN